MADPRRSARSTKGVNSRLSDINVVELPSPVPKRRKSTPKRSSPPSQEEPSNDPTEGKPDDIIRCVCGANEEDEEDERMMIQCEGCDAWQHTICMGIPKKKIPQQYFCEVCSPERHEFLLSQMALGEKPWEKKGGKRRKVMPKPKEATPAKEKKTIPATPAKEKKAIPVTPAKDKKAIPATPAKDEKATPTAPEKGKPTAPEKVKSETPVKGKPTTTEKGKSTTIEKGKPTTIEKGKPTTAEKGKPTPAEKKKLIATEKKKHTPADKEKKKKGKEAVAPVPAPVPAPALVEAEPVPVPEPKVVVDPMLEKPVIDDKMDIDSAEPQPPSPATQGNGDGQLDRMDRDATIPAEDMPPPPPPPPPPAATAPAAPTTTEKKKHGKSLPPIVTEAPPTPAQKSKAKKEAAGKKVTTPVVTTPKSTKRKQSHESDSEYKADDKEQHPEKKQRRISTVATTQEATPKAQKQDRRKSSIATTKKAKKAKEDTTPQKELVNTVSELRNTYRQTVVGFLITCISEHAKRLINDKKITLQQDSTVETLCENRALQIEHHVYLNHFTEGQIVTDYKNKMRTIALNLKSNAALSDEILGGRLSCERLSHMTTEEMASKELKELTQQVRLESEKHNTLINETGPRIRRTHKGEELVNEETTVQSGQDTLLESGTVIRRSSEVVMDEPPPPPPPPAPITPGQPDSPAQPAEASMSPPTTVAATSETPRSPSQALPIEGSAPPLEKKERSFSIENVWSQVESPDTERRPSRLPARPAPVKPVDSKIDKDIDMLLKDDDQDVGTPPYSPASYNDHYSPKPDQDDDTVWRGRIDMNQIANLTATASLLGGPEQLGDKRWFELLDPVLNIDGRIKHERATEYLCGQKFSRSSSMVLASLKPEHSANQAQFDKLFEYFKTKERYAVVGKHNSPCIKDLYIVPIDSNETLPDWFNVVDPPSKVPEKSRSSRMLVLIFVVIRSLVSGHVENGNGIGARRFSAQPTLEFSTPQQPQASPYASQHMPQQQQYQASPLSNQPPQQQPYSPSPLSQPPPQQAHYGSTVPYGYPQQQQHPHPLPSLQAPQQFSPPPQQHPHPPAPLPVPHGYPQHQQSPPPPQQQQQHHSPQPHHQSPRQLPQPLPTQPPLQQEQRPPQRMAFVPKHAMTQELIGLIPKLSEVQAMAIDKLLQEHPELQTKPDVLAKEVEKVLGSVGSGV